MPLLGFPSHVPYLQTALQPSPPAAQPSGGWLTESDAPRRTNTLRIVALAAILATDPVLPPLSIQSTIAHASSGQVSVNTWATYDPTAGPVSPPASSAPTVVLPDDGAFLRKRRRILGDETAAPLAPIVASIAFTPHDSALPRSRKKTVSEDLAAPVGVAPGQFLPNFVAQWAQHASIVRRKWNAAAGASSTAESISSTAAAIASTVAYASSGAIAVNGWSVYDPTTGPVSPPAPQVVRFIDAQSDIRPLKRKTWLPLPTSVVMAIPVDDLWFESLDVPVRIESKGRLTEPPAPLFPPAPATVIVVPHWLGQSEPRQIRRNGAALASTTFEPITAPASATVGTTFVGASSSQVVVHRWSIHDQMAGPVLPPAPIAAPPVVLSDPSVYRRLRQKGSFDPTAAPMFPPAAATVTVVSHWLGQSEPSRIRWNKATAASATIDQVKVDGQFLPTFVAQWAEHQRPTKRKTTLGKFDPTEAPTFPPVVAASVQISQWLGQSEPSRMRWNRSAAASATIDSVKVTGQFLQSFVAQWGEQPRPTKRKTALGRFDPTDALTFLVVAPAPPFGPARTGLSVHAALGLAQLPAGTPAPSLPSIDPTVVPTTDTTRRLTVHGVKDDDSGGE